MSAHNAYPQRVRDRALHLLAQGMTQRAIADKLGCSISLVQKWKRLNRDEIVHAAVDDPVRQLEAVMSAWRRVFGNEP